MNIILESHDTLNEFYEYFDFNDIEFSVQDYFTIVDEEKNISERLIPLDLQNTLAIVNFYSLIDMINSELSRKHLQNFLDNKNVLWVADKYDTSFRLRFFMKQFRKLDDLNKNGSVVLWLDADLANNYNYNFRNIEYNIKWYNWIETSRIKNTTTQKLPNSKAFMLTMKLKNYRPGRQYLAKELKKRPDLLANSMCNMRETEAQDQWMGDIPKHHSHWERYPSMDLYANCYLEIVPETFMKNFYQTTEKTTKPISTKTPFLILSTPGYLTYLRSLGFKTFDTLIDESYDKEEHTHTKVKKLIQVLDHIIDNGAKEFYESSKDILDYNFDNLCSISGKRQRLYDDLIWTWLNKARKKLT